MTNEQAYQAGYEARRTITARLSGNPFSAGNEPDLYDAWKKGWQDRRDSERGAMTWIGLHPDFTPDDLGFLPGFLSIDDPRPAKEQIDANYRHGGGWNAQPGFTLHEDGSLHYPGDPPLKPLAMTQLREELIMFYPHDYVAIVQLVGRSFEAARID
jgi:hypothetical protein